MATNESAGYIESHRPSARNFISRKDNVVVVGRPAPAGKKTISVTSYKYINRYHRGCRNGKEVEGAPGWMGHETKQVNGVTNRGQHHEWCFISLLPALPNGGVVCTCACASPPLRTCGFSSLPHTLSATGQAGNKLRWPRGWTLKNESKQAVVRESSRGPRPRSFNLLANRTHLS